jgi:Putative amidoligase enzyme
MTTPLFRAYKGSPWREEIKETWKFLKKNYVISINAVPEDRAFEKTGCATHVHISIRRGFQLFDMQKIAQFVIHFEPAIEALLPEERRGQLFARSNWLDNKNFVTGKKTRRQAINEIGRTRDRQAVVNLMSPRPSGDHFAWAFSKLDKHKTIEFRKPGPSKSAEETIMWAEFAMAFILSAMQIENTINYIRKVPPNVGGLKQFLLLRKKEPYMCDPTYLAPLWRGKTGKEIQQPKPNVESHWTKVLPGLQRMVEVEETEYLRLYKVEEALQTAVRKRDVEFHRSSSI